MKSGSYNREWKRTIHVAVSPFNIVTSKEKIILIALEEHVVFL